MASDSVFTSPQGPEPEPKNPGESGNDHSHMAMPSGSDPPVIAFAAASMRKKQKTAEAIATWIQGTSKIMADNNITETQWQGMHTGLLELHAEMLRKHGKTSVIGVARLRSWAIKERTLIHQLCTGVPESNYSLKIPEGFMKPMCF